VSSRTLRLLSSLAETERRRPPEGSTGNDTLTEPGAGGLNTAYSQRNQINGASLQPPSDETPAWDLQYFHARWLLTKVWLGLPQQKKVPEMTP
jgi:hypothetical protein